MTNEEIEKRFEFDLNMNVFKTYNAIVSGKEFIRFKIELQNKSFTKLFYVLRNIGYKIHDASLPLCNANTINISVEEKTLRTTSLSSPSKGYNNEIPEYIKEYEIKL